ncbi:MAG: hypothetical protein ACREQ5_13145, partial [Candidatus Dormibacteria bacterium]
ERIFCFVEIQNSDTGNQPQTQLWYSTLGTPWQFNELAQQEGGQVLLVGNGETPSVSSYVGYGDNPIAAISLGSTALLFKSRTAYMLYGTDPTTYFPIFLFPIGCLAKRSVINALGSVYWLSESGVYVMSGGSPTYISEKIKRYLAAIPMGQQTQAVGFFTELAYYLSFPVQGVTFRYYIPTKTWTVLPYATNSAFSIPANPNQFSQSFETTTYQPGEIVAVRGTNGPSNIVDAWLTGEDDLGSPTTFSWTSPLNSSRAPHTQKIYRYVTLLAPIQQGTATVTLTVDPGAQTEQTHTVTFNLGTGETRNIAALTPDIRGYLAQLEVSATNITGATVPLVIYSCTVWGTMDRPLAIPN